MVNGATILGAVAATCTTVAFVPQIQKILKTGGRDLSYPMLALYLTGVSLWLGYGLALGAAALSLANGASILFVGVCISLKWMKERAVTRAKSEPRKLRIAIDMDETIANSLKEHIARFNAAFGASLTEDQLHGANIEDLVPIEQRAAVRDLVNDASFFVNLDIIEGAQDVIRDLSREHDVYIVSAAMEVPTSFASKYAWLLGHFSFIPTSHFVFCGDKTIVNADYLIDDQARHLRCFRGAGILFSAPHNREEMGCCRVESWEEVRRLFLAGHAPAKCDWSDRRGLVVAPE
jgi:5'(3')-deoxyribonucleotidase/uncharacterized protein with PQ loop repeat